MAMLIPSIDLMGGKIVQLVQGERKALEFDDFEEWIERFSTFPLVQLIDLTFRRRHRMIRRRASYRTLEPTPPRVEEVLPDLARFHALLHSPRYASRLPVMVSRSLNRLRTAFDGIYFTASRGERPSTRHQIEQAYIEHAFHHDVLREALNETIPRASA